MHIFTLGLLHTNSGRNETLSAAAARRTRRPLTRITRTSGGIACEGIGSYDNDERDVSDFLCRFAPHAPPSVTGDERIGRKSPSLHSTSLDWIVRFGRTSQESRSALLVERNPGFVLKDCFRVHATSRRVTSRIPIVLSLGRLSHPGDSVSPTCLGGHVLPSAPRATLATSRHNGQGPKQ